jgi:hypothetical protein
MLELDKARDTQEDRIIQYLTKPDSIQLSKTDTETMQACMRVHTLRHGPHKQSVIIQLIERTENVGNRQAYNLLYITEKIFGKVHAINKDYIRAWLMDECRYNVQKAREHGPMAHTKAIKVAAEIAGLDDLSTGLPNFGDLVQPVFKIMLPDNVLNVFDSFLNKGSVNMADIMPPPTIDINHTEVKEGQDEPS